MRPRLLPLSVLSLLVLISVVGSSWALWDAGGSAVVTDPGPQDYPHVVADGTGGVIVVWADWRNGDIDIYAQRLDAAGNPVWTADGVPVNMTSTSTQTLPQVVADGFGGVIVAWKDYRNLNYDIYAQRIDPDGRRVWSLLDEPVCTASGDQADPCLVADGAGGAIIVWTDPRLGVDDIYAQKLDATGAAQWTAQGVVVCGVVGTQDSPSAVSDGEGGVVVGWQDGRGVDMDVYAQRLDPAGAQLWGVNGAAVCSAVGDQLLCRLATDGSSGAIVTWDDSRSGTSWDIYAQHVDRTGAMQWAAGGVWLCNFFGDQADPWIASDGAGGAVVAWEDYRSGSNWDVYAQRVDASGGTMWATGGIAVCTAVRDQRFDGIMADGAGGAYVAWEDNRAQDKDIYAQHVDGAGAALWGADGLAVCKLNAEQAVAALVADGNGGALVAWRDYRSANGDIYAHYVDDRGRLGYLPPTIAGVSDVPGDQGGNVYLSFDASAADALNDPAMSYYSFWRAINTTSAQAAAGGTGRLVTAADVRPDAAPGLVRVERTAATTYYWELVSTMFAYHLPSYAKTIPTLFDSTSVTGEYHYFQVIAHSTNGAVFWISDPDSGYSVDNLAPAAPQALAGAQTGASGIELTWDPNSESDLAHYVVYRGTDPGFTPEPGNRLGSPTGTVFDDPGWTWDGNYYYKVTAVDIHENESPVALLGPAVVTGAGDVPGRSRTFLGRNVPNPFNPFTSIAFGLKTSGRVSLEIYDVSGRRVRVLENGWMKAGLHTSRWDGRNDAGTSVSSGVYFVRLRARDFVDTQKVVLEK